ncbi:hypothetical protein FQA39_LY11232 [Lamprigera yunnana]|nr:hypothetical protein FQA39_LY11232 [Lamprigera yunnana]
MFVSNIVKKCVNLFTHDSSKNDGKVDGENKSAVDTSLVVKDDNVLQDALESVNDLSVTLTQDYVNAVTEDIYLDSVIDSEGGKLPELEHNMEKKDQIISKKRNSILRNFDPLYSADYTSSVTTETLINIKENLEKSTFTESTESFSYTTDSEDNLEITVLPLNNSNPLVNINDDSVDGVCLNICDFDNSSQEIEKNTFVEEELQNTTDLNCSREIQSSEEAFRNKTLPDDDVDVPNTTNYLNTAIVEISIIETSKDYNENTTFEDNVKCDTSKENTEATITTEEEQIAFNKEMDEVSEQINRLEEEVADLKLQLNASQQIQATLELQLTQKEEILIKSQRESLRKDQCFKQEMKQLKDSFEEKNSDDSNAPLKELQETIKSLKLKITSLLGELAALDASEECYKKKMNEYEETLETQVSELQKLNEEQCVLKQHLATLQLALSDVFQKYERSKKIIEGYKCNEDALRQSLATSENTTVKSEQKYESLKAHAKAQLEKSNQELLLMREQYDAELHKITAKIRRLEINHSSFTESLDQKSKECAALATLWDELTGGLYSN